MEAAVATAGRAAAAGRLVEEAEPGVEEVYGEVAVMVVAAMALGYLERVAAVGAGLEGGAVLGRVKAEEAKVTAATGAEATAVGMEEVV